MLNNFVSYDRDTLFLMPPSVQDWVPQGHPARFVVDIVAQLDLRTIRESYEGRGSATYHPEKAYDAVFNAITLNVKFDVVEVRQIAPDWAFVRTNSAGTTKVSATGEGGPEANQELFVFQKIDGAWKIARYCFSTTNPPRA